MSPIVRFDPGTGEVKLCYSAGAQTLFKLTSQGVCVWSKLEKTQVLIPWHEIMVWVAQAIRKGRT